MRVAIVALVAACSSPSVDDFDGPFTGVTYRYALDAIELPTTNTMARELAADIDGDGQIDNQLGMVFSTLHTDGNITTHAFDMIAGGVIASSIEIIADDPLDDDTVGVRYVGSARSSFGIVGGGFERGRFRTRLDDRADGTGEAELRLPVFADADPSTIIVRRLALELAPDGVGGFDVMLHGAVAHDDAFLHVVTDGVMQMVASEPSQHRTLMKLLDDRPRDGVLTPEEIVGNPLIITLLSPDLEIDGVRMLSIGIRAHARPCAEGSCLMDVAFDHCFDRIRDADETDVDCGGSCQGCVAGATCSTGTDCETTTCEQGRCGPPSCTNGARDGLESDIDCGASCGACPSGSRCYFSSDCTSRVCGAPCDGSDCDLNTHASTCR